MKISSSVKRAFSDRSVIVTGAASGIGRALCLRLLACGAKVHAFDASEEGLANLQAEPMPGGTLHSFVMDVRDRDAYENAVREVERLSGPVDYFFNNAGVTLLGEAHRIPFDRWKWLLDINLMGVINGIHTVYPLMVERRQGTIINTASIAGGTGYATAAAYTASKGAVLELSRSLAAEAKFYGVRVAAACPGYVDSNIFQQERIFGADRAKMISDLPVKMMTPDQAADWFLKGAASKKEIFVFPFTAWFLWTLCKWAPSWTRIFHKRFIRTFR